MDRRLTLFLLGFLTLFLELALIRYLGGNVWNLSYFPNFVLLSVFGGMGLGFVLHPMFSARASAASFQGAAFLLCALVAFVLLGRPAVPGFGAREGQAAGELFFTWSPSGSEGGGVLPFVLLFVGVATLFVCISQRTAKVFASMPPLDAYTFDIAGSCAGVVVFIVASSFGAPAWTWFFLVLPLFLLAGDGASRMRWLPAAPLFLVVALVQVQDATPLADAEFRGEFEVSWSPYQKVEWTRSPTGHASIYANGLVHQNPVSMPVLETLMYPAPHVARAASGLPPYRDVLVLGAGSGNDVAVALAKGARRVDAVEIDPVLAGLGRRHPARPYEDPRVHVIVDDGRAFLARTNRKWDLIIFALTDSVVQASSLAQLRLENYLFTEEAVRRAYEHLSPNGDLVFYNHYRRPWLIEKIARLVESASGHYPRLLLQRHDLVVLAANRSPDNAAARPTGGVATVDVPTDDWPFLYLERRGIPQFYGVAMGVAVAASVLLLVVLERSARRRSAAQASVRTKIAFLLMGAAFLLLETKSVVQWGLLFGTTWRTTSLVFLAVLVLVLAANRTVARLHSKRVLPIAFTLLAISCILMLAWPLSSLLAIESEPLRFAAAMVLTFGPIYFANLVFSEGFRDQHAAEVLFGWNLIGAMLGGVAEYASMAVGYNALAAGVAALYAASFALLKSQSRANP